MIMLIKSLNRLSSLELCLKMKRKDTYRMKRITIKQCLAAILALAMLLSFAPLALADSSFYYAPVIDKFTVYRSMDKIKSFYDVNVGSYIQVYGTQNWEGTTWLRVAANADDGSKQIGYVSTAAIPAGIPTTSFIGTATATATTNLYSNSSTSSTAMLALPICRLAL